MAAESPNTFYFGYGSNLWREQMARRCPDSTFLGIARLRHYAWFINDRGYANIVYAQNHEVWGSVYSLTATDEASLDRNEGVPDIYQKETKSALLWGADSDGFADPTGPSKNETLLVYIDHDRTTTSKPKQEYIYRMNRGIEDALRAGIPRGYVQGVIREYIPKDQPADPEVEQLALRQAQDFESE